MGTTERERLLEVLDAAECRRLLATASIGRIAFTEGALPAIQLAAYTLQGEDVFIPVDPGSTMAASSRGAVLAFGVDDYDFVERTGWNVTVIGPSRLVSVPEQVRALDGLGVVPWPPATTHCYIALRMAVVRGQRMSSTDPRVDAAVSRTDRVAGTSGGRPLSATMAVVPHC